MKKSVSGPMEGEHWKIERTLPSGLHIGITRNQRILADISYVGSLGRKLPQFEPIDHREYQYNIERLKHERRHFDRLETESLAWHPSKPLLVTAGSGNLIKLWNILDGRLLTKYVRWKSISSIRDIWWAPDGAFFVAYEHYRMPIICDGTNGEIVCSIPSARSIYNLKGGGGYMFFNPWRPNSNQITTEKKGVLNLWNRESGKLEHSIDCNVKEIFHFSWHPSGRFIAIWDLNNFTTSIIDAHSNTIIAVLPDRALHGWLPDGKGVWVRTRDRQNHFVWDAEEMREEPISTDDYKGGILRHRQGLKTNTAWDESILLQDTFSNLSADGLRYIEVRGEAKIFSSESCSVVATLPEKVEMAAWSPHDGGLLATCASRGGETHIWRLQA